MELADWDDSQVQLVYKLLCSEEMPNDPNAHWEGWLAQRIIAELKKEKTTKHERILRFITIHFR